MKLKKKHLAFLISGLFAGMSAVYAADTTEVGRITVEGAPGGTDTGLITPEESPKARSSVNSKAIEKQAPTANAFQLLQLAPGVSTFDQDGTGLFGATMRVRGFNSNQIGMTLDGAPLNDSLNYSIFIQEFADPENLCDLFITQGSTDIDAPHVGASGGNIGITTCDPKDELGGKFNVALGSNNYRKEFLRFDSGRFLNDRAKFFISISDAKADKFKGPGKADRQHVDAKGQFDFGGGSFSRLTYLYNKMNNANYRTLSKADIATYGRNHDFGTRPPVHATPVAGTAQNDRTLAANADIFSGANMNYGPFNNNPFENYQVSMVNHWQLSPKASIQVNPYYIYGYGFGGPQLTTLAESNGAGFLHGGVQDINGDGDTLDTVAVYGSNTSETSRWGLTAKADIQVDNHKLTAGVWQDKGESTQFGPATRIDSAGNTADYWLDNQGQHLLYQDGTRYSSRNWLTDVTARSLFFQDSMNFMQDKLNVLVGLKRQTVKRNFRNTASGTGVNANGADYSVDQKFSDTLGNLGIKYQLSDTSSVFGNLAENVRAPENNASTGLIRTGGATVVNGVMTPATLLPVAVKSEKSNNLDIGYRYAGDALTFSGSVFLVDYRDRIASQYDPVVNQSTSFNVGDSKTTGFEMEAGYKFNSAWNLYGSLTYNKSEMRDNLVRVAVPGGSTVLPTAGKQMPDTPKWLAGLNLQYTSGPFYSFVQGRYVGERYTTLVNDDKLSGYTLFDLGAGYRFPAFGFAKNPTIRLTVNNLFDKEYLSMTGPSGSSFTNNVRPVVTPGGTVAGNVNAAGIPTSPSLYVGAPRSIQIAFTSEF